MSETAANPVLDRLMRHMKWANQRALATLQELPEENLRLHAAGEPEWTVYAIARHLVDAAGFYCRRLGADVEIPDADSLPQRESMQTLSSAVSTYDHVLREQSTLPEAVLIHKRPDGVEITRARSTILGQAIHHATEHRAQIAGILAGHGIRAIDLDELDVWAYGDFEGLGN